MTGLECVYCRQSAVTIQYGMAICEMAKCAQASAELPRAIVKVLAAIASKNGAPFTAEQLRDVTP